MKSFEMNILPANSFVTSSELDVGGGGIGGQGHVG